jgi:hypothetical protein
VWQVQLLARVPQRERQATGRTTRRVRVSPVARVWSSPRKRWTQRSQFAGMPKNPSQTR